MNEGLISLYFLALLLQYHQLLLYKILLHQEPAGQVTVNTLCMVEPAASSSHFYLQVPLTWPVPWLPWRPNTVHLNTSMTAAQTANSHFREEEIIAAVGTPIRVHVSPKERGISIDHWPPNALRQHQLVGCKYRQSRSAEPKGGHLSLCYITLSSLKHCLITRLSVMHNNYAQSLFYWGF